MAITTWLLKYVFVIDCKVLMMTDYTTTAANSSAYRKRGIL